MKTSFVLISFFFTFLSLSQNTYRFRNYTINDGLSQSAISTIVQDETGMLWLGTQDGLNRFDGQNVEIFNSDLTKGIENEYILSSLRAKNELVWFGTTNGLTQYNPKKEAFKTFLPTSKSAFQAETITEDNIGNIWVGTASGELYKWDKKTEKIVPVLSKLKINRINFIHFISAKELLVCTEDKGAYLLNTQTKKIQSILFKEPNVRVYTAKKWSESEWVLGSNVGLFAWNSVDGKTNKLFPEINQQIGEIDIRDIVIENQHFLFLATQNKGLVSVENKAGKVTITQSTSDILQSSSILSNEINTLFKDENGTLWLGSIRGLSSLDLNTNGFKGVGISADLTKGLPNSSVWSIAEDPQGEQLFIGLENAVSVLNRKTGKFQTYSIFEKKGGEKDKEITVLSLKYIEKQKLLLGTTDGLYSLDIRNPSNYNCHKIELKTAYPAGLFDRVYDIAHYKDDFYFLATKGGVVLFDYQKQTSKAFVHDPKNPTKTIRFGICRLVYKDSDGKIWFGTSTGGLNELRTEKGLEIVPSPWNSIISKVSKDQITSIFQIDKNNYCLGTIGSGFLLINKQTKKVKNFTQKQGLANNVVYGVLSNEAGKLWMSTNKGLSMFDLSTKKFENYTEIDGLLSNEFNQGAFLKAKNGELIFGGIYGYNFFKSSDLKANTQPIDIRFTKIKLDKDWLTPGDETGILKQNLFHTKQLEFSYKQRSFSIMFMALNMSNPDLINYKYQLEGSDEGEIFIGNNNQIHFNSLQAGDYVLRVYARFGKGEWCENPAVIEFYIAVPFWQRAWFWIVLILIIGLAVFVFIRKQIDNERREQVRLEIKIAERTREIREQNIKIEKQKKTIEEKKNRLEDQKRLLEIERDKTEKLLRNIIPVSTYEELKNTGKASARAYKTVSVMFTDFVGFTKIAERMKPSDLVGELDIYFRKFDEIIVRNNLEKIKTIGDAYMCAGGVPVRNNTNPIDACLAALQIQHAMENFQELSKKEGRELFELRLGINTGEVTAGVIGSEKLAYDIWGSTVNQAQRMEMLGEPGKVTVSGQTFKHIEPYFKCTFRGKVRTKSKGLIDMYTVDHIKKELSVDGKGIFPNDKFKKIVTLHFYSSINYYKAERHIMKVLNKSLSPKLHYHSVEHTIDVCLAIERLAISEGVTDENLFLLKSAATYHDAGFVESYEKNEPVGARMAAEILPNYGYSAEHIEQIKKLIFVTQIPHNPTNKLEEIICDADLDYLGRDDFHEIADKLRLELREHGKIDSDRKWDEIQVGFLTAHRYFTETAKASRDAKKAQNLREIKARLERNEYKD